MNGMSMNAKNATNEYSTEKTNKIDFEMSLVLNICFKFYLTLFPKI